MEAILLLVFMFLAALALLVRDVLELIKLIRDFKSSSKSRRSSE